MNAEDVPIDIWFADVRTKKVLHLSFDPSKNASDDFSLVIRHDDMKLVSEVIQDMSEYINNNDLYSEADFPEEMRDFQLTLDKIE